MLDLESGVYLIGEETLLALTGWEVLDFVDLQESVSQGDGLLEFWGAPGSSECTLLRRLGAVMRFLQERFAPLFFHASAAEREREFALVTDG